MSQVLLPCLCPQLQFSAYVVRVLDRFVKRPLSKQHELELLVLKDRAHRLVGRLQLNLFIKQPLVIKLQILGFLFQIRLLLSHEFL